MFILIYTYMEYIYSMFAMWSRGVHCLNRSRSQKHSKTHVCFRRTLASRTHSNTCISAQSDFGRSKSAKNQKHVTMRVSV